jgi:hypothetical protein
MAQTLNINKYGGTVTFSATSDPAGPTLAYNTTGNTWATRSGNVVTVAANNNANDRSFDITVTATTVSSASYEGTASAYSAYTITQAGTGTTTYNIGIHLWGSDDGFTVSLYDANTHTLLGSYDNMVDSDIHSYTINNFGETCYVKVKKTNPGGSYTVGFVYSNDPQQGDVTEWRTIDGSDEVSFSDFTTAQGKSGGVFIL